MRKDAIKEEMKKKGNTHTNTQIKHTRPEDTVSHKCPALNRYSDIMLQLEGICGCVWYVCETREKHRERLQIRKSVLRLCCIWPGSPGQLGYHVMEKIAIFSSGSLTYLSSHSNPSSLHSYLSSLSHPLCVSHSSSIYLYLLFTPQQLRVSLYSAEITQ